MKRVKILLSILLCGALLFLGSCAKSGQATGKGEENTETNPPLAGESRVLVAYFSWSASHNTQTMAEYIADETGGELFRILPETPYSTVYNEVTAKAQEEKKAGARPALANDLTAEEFAAYDVVFIGYPIWWYDAPMIIYSFLEAHDFSGKTLVPFATSGGSSLNEEEEFRKITGATVPEGLCISGFSAGDSARERVKEWIRGLELSAASDVRGSESVAGVRVKMKLEEQTVMLTLVDNSASRDLVSRLKQAPITLTFSDYNGSEKIAYPSPKLDVSDASGCDPAVGDLTIYTPWGNLAAFYRDSAGYSDSLVPVGRIEGDGISILAAREGEFTVSMELENNA